MTDPVVRPWRRVFVEGFVIVVSILLAFAIDAWWDDRVEKRREVEHLTSIRAELEASRIGLDSVLESVQGHARNMDAFIDLLKSAGEAPVSVPAELLGSSVTWRTSDLSTSTLNALMASGELNLIRNRRLRSGLAGLSAELVDLTEDEVIAKDFAESDMAVFMAREGLAEMAWAYRESVQGPNGVAKLQNLPGEVRVRPSEELIGMLTIRRVHLWYSEMGLPRVREYLLGLIDQIDEELDRLSVE